MSRDERNTPSRPAEPAAERKKDHETGYGEAMKELPSGPIVAPAKGRRLAFLPLAAAIIIAVAVSFAVVALLLS